MQQGEELLQVLFSLQVLVKDDDFVYPCLQLNDAIDR